MNLQEFIEKVKGIVGQCESQVIDKRLNQIPDQTREDQYLGLDGLWYSLKGILEPQIVYPKGKFYETVPGVLTKDTLDNLRIDKFSRLIVKKSPFFIRFKGHLSAGAGQQAFPPETWVRSDDYAELFNTCVIEIYSITGIYNVKLHHLRFFQLESDEYYNTIYNVNTDSDNLFASIRFTATDVMKFEITCGENCELWYRLAFFFDDSLPLLDEDDMASDSEVSVASQQSIKAFLDAHTALVNPHSTKLNDIVNPDGDTNLNMANKHLKFNFTTPAHAEDDGAFEIEATGAFSGHLIHAHQHTGTPGENTELLHLEASHDNCSVLSLHHKSESMIFDKDGLQIGAGAKVIEIENNDSLGTSDVKLCTQGNVKAYHDAYEVAQHNREITPMTLIPEQGHTAGGNNCYMSADLILFGQNSKTNNNFLFLYFKIPDDYVSGENLALYISWRSPVGSDVVDYKIRFDYTRNGIVLNLIEIPEATWTGGGANTTNIETVNIIGTNVQAGDIITVRVLIEDANHTVLIISYGFWMIVPVNSRD